MAIRAPGYTVDDLDWARQQFGTAHVELAPWGNLTVSPASFAHERAVAVLHAQLLRQLDLPDGCVTSNGYPWRVPGGSRYLNVPDLMVIAAGAVQDDELQFAPPPLLVVEMASPSTLATDRTRKLSDYRLGGAGLYLLVDLPGLAPVDAPTAEIHDFGDPSRSITGATGTVTFMVAGVEVTVDLDALRGQ